MASGNEQFSWGKDAVVPCARAPGRVCEVLDAERACEQATTHVADTRTRGTSK